MSQNWCQHMIYGFGDHHYVCVDIDCQFFDTWMHGQSCALTNGDSTSIILALDLQSLSSSWTKRLIISSQAISPKHLLDLKNDPGRSSQRRAQVFPSHGSLGLWVCDGYLMAVEYLIIEKNCKSSSSFTHMNLEIPLKSFISTCDTVPFKISLP